MEHILFRAPSVGGVVNKILAINENLTSQEIIAIVRQATRPSPVNQDDFGVSEIIDEPTALALARQTLDQKHR